MTAHSLKYALPDGVRPKVTVGSQNPRKREVKRFKGRFLKGPIPLSWLFEAAAQPGKAFHVAIALWFLVGVKTSSTVSLSNKLAAEFGVDRYAKARALTVLSKADLIVVEQRRGCSPVVSILEVSNDG